MGEEHLIAGRFRMGNRLGKGSFGEIFSAVDTQENGEVAVKVESIANKHQTLVQESRVIRDLQGIPGVPKLHWFGLDGESSVMIIDLLGPSLEDLFNVCNRKLTLKTVLQLGGQMFERIEGVHNMHYIHRDIKPDNFLIGLGKKADTVYIIDFGLSKKYRDQKTHQHIPYKEGRSLTGTARYASINTHSGIEQSRRDDLESIVYVLIYLLKGELPWQGIRAKSKNEKYHRILEQKAGIPIERLCDGTPEAFSQMLIYTRSLKFEELPDYSLYSRLIRQVCVQSRIFLNNGFDWDPPKRVRSHSNASESRATDSHETGKKKGRGKKKKNSRIEKSKTVEKFVTKDGDDEDSELTPRDKQRWPNISERTRQVITVQRGTLPSTKTAKEAANCNIF